MILKWVPSKQFVQLIKPEFAQLKRDMTFFSSAMTWKLRRKFMMPFWKLTAAKPCLLKNLKIVMRGLSVLNPGERNDLKGALHMQNDPAGSWFKKFAINPYYF